MREGVVAIVLAAGKGSRLGGSKALLLVRGQGGTHGEGERTLVEVQCAERLTAESGRAIAVVRADVAALVGDRLRAAGAEVLISDAPEEQGPAGSLAAAAAYLKGDLLRAAIVTPVDVRVASSTVRALVDALSGAPVPLAAVPRFAGRRGHPVVLGPDALARYGAADPPPLRDFLRGLGARALAVDVEDPFIAEDLNSPAQKSALLRLSGSETPFFLR